MGYSEEHASSVGLILNLKTKRISPQFHVIYDDYFTTVRSVDDTDNIALNSLDWDTLYSRLPHDRVVSDEQDIPELSDEWLTPVEITDKNTRLRQRNRQPPTPLEPLQPFKQPESINMPPDEIIDLTDDSTIPQPSSHQREHASIKREPDKNSNNISPSEPKSPTSTPSVPSTSIQLPSPLSSPAHEPPVIKTRSGRVRKLNKKFFGDEFSNFHFGPDDCANLDLSNLQHFYHADRAQQELKRKYTKLDRHLEYLQGLDWDTSINALAASSTSFESQQFFTMLESYADPSTGILEEGHPLALASKVADSDTPRWKEALYGDNSEGFWEAMWIEVLTLLKMKAWEQVERTPEMNVVKSTWAFKIKRFPSGLVRKLKSRFCVRGDTQVEGVDYFESFAPVVSWKTVRLLLILSVILNLESSQVDYLAAFCQAPIDTEVYIDLPRGWHKLNEMGLPIKFKEGHVLKLQRSLYGLVQSPKNFFAHLKTTLLSEEVGFKQSEYDPCLFFSGSVICLVYVDDCLFFSPSQKDIDLAIERIKAAGMDLSKEDNAAGFLGVNIEKNPDGTVTLQQPGLIERIIKALGVDESNPKLTPCPTSPLQRDIRGRPFSAEFNYASVVGMLMYLCNNSRPEIAFAVNQCARYTHSPTELHAKYLKHIGKYLKKTSDKGLILNPDKNTALDIVCYADADFAGLWNKDEEHDPHTVRSRAGWIIMVGGCPVIWRSKLISEICLSTMESEYIALSTSCRDLLPLQHIVKEVGASLGMNEENLMTIKSTIWEDNQAALKLANLELPTMTNRSKHIGIKYHWFRSFVGKLWVVNPISTHDQLADIFTKGLPQPTFEKPRFRIMGW